MYIDISRVNLLEKDIEDWLYENPSGLPESYAHGAITKWIGRQYTLPSGIADLIGVHEDGMLVVVEVKNVPINKAAVLQVCRYQDDLKYIVSERVGYPHLKHDNEPEIEMVLVGPSIDGQTFSEARAVGVTTYQFTAKVTLDINRLSWNDDHRAKVRVQHAEIAARPEWEIFGLTNIEDYAQFKKEQEELKEQELDEVFGRISKHAHEYMLANDKIDDVTIESPDEGDDIQL